MFSSFLLARTARNYRRLSGQMKASLVERTEQTHLRSVSTVLATLPGSTGKQRGSNYVQHERYSYLLESKKTFEAGHSIGLVLDGVQLGDPILNCIAWDSKSKHGCILPPQAGFFTTFIFFQTTFCQPFFNFAQHVFFFQTETETVFGLLFSEKANPGAVKTKVAGRIIFQRSLWFSSKNKCVILFQIHTNA